MRHAQPLFELERSDRKLRLTFGAPFGRIVALLLLLFWAAADGLGPQTWTVADALLAQMARLLSAVF